MPGKPDEQDWQAFRKMTPILRERYLGDQNAELAAILGDDERSPTEKFWDLKERAREIEGALRACLDGHSRSKMKYFIMQMLRVGMMRVEDLEVFSEDLRERMIEWSKQELET